MRCTLIYESIDPNTEKRTVGMVGATIEDGIPYRRNFISIIQMATKRFGEDVVRAFDISQNPMGYALGTLLTEGSPMGKVMSEMGLREEDAFFVNPAYAIGNREDMRKMFPQCRKISVHELVEHIAELSAAQYGFAVFADEEDTFIGVSVYNPREEDQLDIRFGEICPAEKKRDNAIVKFPLAALNDEKILNDSIREIECVIQQKYGDNIVLFLDEKKEAANK